MGGYTFSHDDPDKLANEILNLILDKSKKEDINKDFVNNFSSESVGIKFQKVLEL